jgi:HTH-type transcriptional regulator/antitoxin HigA
MERKLIMIAELEKVIEVWPNIKDVLSVPHTERHYNKLIKIMDELLDEVGENEKHPLLPLLETIGSLIESYENDNIKIENSNPIETLKELMKEHNLSQNDLKIIGTQGVVSEILNGKRALNARQIKALADKFHVSSAVFI